MPNNGKYLNLDQLTGIETLEQGVSSSAGSADAGKIVVLDAQGRFDVSMLPVGVGPDVTTAPASEALSSGNYVNFWVDSGVVKVRLADGSNGRTAQGFVKSSVAIAGTAIVFHEGPNDQLSTIVAGSPYFLGTLGTVTTTPRTTGIHQLLGWGVGTTTVNTELDRPIKVS